MSLLSFLLEPPLEVCVPAFLAASAAVRQVRHGLALDRRSPRQVPHGLVGCGDEAVMCTTSLQQGGGGPCVLPWAISAAPWVDGPSFALPPRAVPSRW